MGNRELALTGRKLTHNHKPQPHTTTNKTTPHHQTTTAPTTEQSYGGNSDRETPGPIPNPEAKPASADDTTQPGWKSRTPPNTFRRPLPPNSVGGQRHFDYSMIGGLSPP